MDLRTICSRYALCISVQKFEQLPNYVHNDVLYDSKPPMTAHEFGQMLDGLIRDWVDFRLDVDMLVVEPSGASSHLNGMVSARFRLSHETPSEKAAEGRVVFYEHVFFNFQEGKIAQEETNARVKLFHICEPRCSILPYISNFGGQIL
ncbi:hypothetical protein G647_08963 [Cladophialophora carrionii CBS 160.54]|uniref:SnoaL-like domain-containing protein n=1 Tax=Cladophialophora carrionii CBS 160.54 TaxID=1279043 RepID=V9D106_9EURO|nr:uncharacterized protein G647_08963 [Cladophialophora carrionii CBS 160.54]ETI19948.1 hypothetical protein G647_08963 [Cladophialophora carrionii CBS 160.54]